MRNCCTWKFILGIILGLVLAVGIFCLTVAIACAVNGVSFGEQIVDWFGTMSLTTAKFHQLNFRF